MAGGSGTRLWPASNSKRPKQFLNLPSCAYTAGAGAGVSTDTDKNTKTFFGAALERALAVCKGAKDSRIIIVAGKSHIDPIIKECSRLDANEKKRLVLIPEPLARNTAPAIACALRYIEATSAKDTKHNSGRNILVLTSDHIIKPLDKFASDVNAAAEAARAGKLVVFGIPPERPDTGYGYIEAAARIAFPCKGEIFSAASFREKPDIKTAKKFVALKNFYWNSGMFAFSSGFMIAEYLRNSPSVIAPFIKLGAPDKKSYRIRKGLKILEAWDNLETAYRKAPAISFDYAIAEKCRDVAMVKTHFSWTDVGNWDEYARLTKGAKAEVFEAGRAEKIKSKAKGNTPDTCFVDSDIPVAICGADDLIVVVRTGRNGEPRAVLIAKKGETQRVKEIVEKIKASGRNDLL